MLAAMTRPRCRRSPNLMLVRAGLLLGSVAACGSPAAAPDAADPLVIESRSAGIGPVTVPAGGEDTVCVVVDLGNDAPRMLRAIHTHLGPGTHHVIVSRSDLPLAPEPAPCGAFSGGGFGTDNDLLFIAEQSEASIDYPAGAGLPLEAHQHLHLEMHYINTQPAGDQDIGATADFDLAADDGVTLRPVDVMFTGDLQLLLPAGEQTTAGGIFDLPDGVDLFAAVAHTHQWGEHATVELLDGGDDPAPILLHESTNWAERQLSVFEPIHITERHKIRLTCDFDNQSGHDVTFGLSANDEMCFFWAHYVSP